MKEGAAFWQSRPLCNAFSGSVIQDQTNSIYVIATIKEDAILGTSTANGGNVPPASSAMSLPEGIKEVKPEDTRKLANLPNPFLSKDQRLGKRRGLQEKGGCLCDKARNAGKKVDAPATMTTERIDQEFRNNGVKCSPDYRP